MKIHITYNSSDNSESFMDAWGGVDPEFQAADVNPEMDTLVLSKAPGRELNLLYFRSKNR